MRASAGMKETQFHRHASVYELDTSPLDPTIMMLQLPKMSKVTITKEVASNLVKRYYQLSAKQTWK